MEHDPSKIEEILLERNKMHFRQATGIQFTADLLDAIPFTADCEVAENVLLGKDFESSTTDAAQILKHCRRRIDEDQEEIKLEEIRNGFRRWDEETSMSPPGLHLGI